MASIDFTELFATITSATTGSWATIDLTSLGVDDNAVVCVLIQHFNDTATGICGVREVDSIINRYLTLHESEVGGSTSTVMHVQSNATASIEYYKEDANTVFTLLGWYGAGITFTEAFGLLEPTAADWRVTEVGQANRVFEFACVNIDDVNEPVIGVRKVGSSLVRSYAVDEAEPAAAEAATNSYTSYAQSDSGDDVELYRSTTDGIIYNLGYFSSNIQLTEAFTVCTPSSDDTWRELTAAGYENTVALIACMHASTGTEENTGARGGASAVARYWLEHEAEGGGFTGDTLPVLVDAGGKYDTYFGDVSDALFYCLGYLYDSTQPTVALNTADLTNFGADTTPALDFTGTDAFPVNDITYNIQIDTVNTFNSVAGPTLIDTYNESNYNADTYLYSGSAMRIGQSFVGQGGYLSSCKFYLKKNNSPTGTAKAYLYAITGTLNTDAIPIGNALATSTTTLDIDTGLTSSYQLKAFTFDETVEVKRGQPYAIVVVITGGDASNSVVVGYDSTTPSHDGNRCYGTVATWYSDANDLIFYVYTTNSPLLDQCSSLDAGFSGDPDNADPFASAQLVTFTVQAALDDDTYYWRVCGMDAEDDMVYGAWSGTREFYVAAAGGAVAPTSVLYGPLCGPLAGPI